MDDERAQLLGEPSALPEECRWQALRTLTGEALEARFKKTLTDLSRRDGLLGALFLKAEGKVNDPAKLQRLVSLIDGETWMGLDVDVKGTIYEGLLERNAGEVKSGAGQYFTPRPLIQAMAQLIDPEPNETVHTRPSAPAASCSPPTTSCAPSPAPAIARPPSNCARRTFPAKTSSPTSSASAP